MKSVIRNAIISMANKAGHANAPHDAMNYAQAALNLANTYTAIAYVELEENRQQVGNAADNRLAQEKEKRE